MSLQFLNTSTINRLPLNPSLEQLRNQAKDLLKAYVAGESEALKTFDEFHPQGPPPNEAKLADAQFVLARSYSFSSWPRLRLSVELAKAVWDDDAPSLRRLVTENPDLLDEQVRGEDSSWGPPMSYAANMGKTELVEMLAGLGADDLDFAFDRAALQGKIETARRLNELGAKPKRGIIMGACENANGEDLEFLVDEMGAELVDKHGDPDAPVALALETYSRSPEGKHRCLELFVRHAVELPDSPAMAFHRGRIDLLEDHLGRDPNLLSRRFSYSEIYPPKYRHSEDTGLHGTPLGGTTLLHMAIDFDEAEIFDWLLEKGADVDARAEVDQDGFGGHTPLFNTVVSQAVRCGRQKDAAMARSLLERGADPNTRASIRKALKFMEDESVHEYQDVTPLGYGRRFHEPTWVNDLALEIIQEFGG